MTLRDKFKSFYAELRLDPPAGRQSEPEEKPDPFVTIATEHIDPEALGNMLRLELEKALHAEIEKAAKGLAEQFLYRTEEGKKLLQAARDSVKNYPITDFRTEEKLRQAVANAIMSDFQTVRKHP